MPGNKYLKSVLNQCAYAHTRSKDAPYKAWYWKLQRRSGKKKAIVGLSRKLLVLCYTMIDNGTPYDPNYLSKLTPTTSAAQIGATTP